MQLNTPPGFRTMMVFLANRQWHAPRPVDKRYGERRSSRRLLDFYPGERRTAPPERT